MPINHQRIQRVKDEEQESKYQLKSAVVECECGNKFIKTRVGQDRCIKCLNKTI